MRVLMHMCCGPCTTYPLKQLREKGYEIHGFFFNPNIHPYQEFIRRMDTLLEYAGREACPVDAETEYGLVEFLRQVVGKEDKRCPICYHMRLRKTAEKAREEGFDAFSTTLLISPYQNHEQIRRMGEALAKEFGVPFLYEDFRVGFRDSVTISKEQGMYRQQYCGCIYSEHDRYKPRPKKSKGGQAQ